MNGLHHDRSKTIEKGQLWKTEHGFLLIEELGQRVTHYKLMRRADQKAAATRLMTIEALANVLHSDEAELVNHVVDFASPQPELRGFHDHVASMNA
jgi:hypothetical protein